MLDDYCREIGRYPDTLDRSLYYWVPKADLDPWPSKDAFFSVLEPEGVSVRATLSVPLLTLWLPLNVC